MFAPIQTANKRASTQPSLIEFSLRSNSSKAAIRGKMALNAAQLCSSKMKVADKKGHHTSATGECPDSAHPPPCPRSSLFPPGHRNPTLLTTAFRRHPLAVGGAGCFWSCGAVGGCLSLCHTTHKIAPLLLGVAGKRRRRNNEGPSLTSWLTSASKRFALASRKNGAGGGDEHGGTLGAARG